MVRVIGWVADSGTTFDDSFAAYSHQARNTSLLPPIDPTLPSGDRDAAGDNGGKRRRVGSA